MMCVLLTFSMAHDSHMYLVRLYSSCDCFELWDSSWVFLRQQECTERTARHICGLANGGNLLVRGGSIASLSAGVL